MMNLRVIRDRWYVLARGWKAFAASIALSAFVSLTTYHVAFAAFEETGTGARAAALGDNYVTMGDDVLSLMYNPAGLARVERKEITSEYSRLYTGLSDGSNLAQSFLGYGQRIP